MFQVDEILTWFAENYLISVIGFIIVLVIIIACCLIHNRLMKDRY